MIEKWQQFLNSQSLRTRLILWFLIIALLPLGWTAIASYHLSKKMLIKQAMDYLTDLSLRQGQLLRYYFQEKEEHARILSEEISAPKAIVQLSAVLAKHGKDSPEYQAIEEKFRPLFEFQTRLLDYRNLLLISANGQVVFSILPEVEPGLNLLSSSLHPILSEIFTLTLQTQQMEITSFIIPDKTLFSTFIASPLFVNQQLIGVLLAQIDTAYITRHLSEFNNVGLSGKMLLAAKVEDRLFEINPSEMTSRSYPSHPISTDSSFGKFIEDVLADRRALGIVEEDHGHEDLMVGKHIMPGFNWAIIIKIDQQKLLALVTQFTHWSFLFIVMTTCAVIVAASYVARKLASPILALTQKTKQLAAGNLSERITVTSQDEIGHLGESFNHMAEQLDHLITHLDELVATRTQAFEEQNIQLQQTIDELTKTKDRLVMQEKLASLGTLTAGIAHEIKNPLNFINNFAELCSQLQNNLQEHLLRLETVLPKEDMEGIKETLATLQLDLTKIIEHGKRADSIVHRMLQHSRTLPGEEETIDLHALLDEYISLSYHSMRGQDPTFNVKIEKEYDPSLPKIRGISQELSRVFLNLLNNAYYAVQQKAKQGKADYQPTVKISTSHQANSISVKIWDNGLGMTEDVLSKLFTPFFTTKPPGEGTGLGLSLSYNIIVQGHGGTLTATSEPGAFAEFIVTLPLR